MDEFAAQIRAGHLPAGRRLPTHRKLAAQHGLALVTATRVYAELQDMGLVSGEAGRGTFVKDLSSPLGQGRGLPHRARRPYRPELQQPHNAGPGGVVAIGAASVGERRRSRIAAALPTPMQAAHAIVQRWPSI